MIDARLAAPAVAAWGAVVCVVLIGWNADGSRAQTAMVVAVSIGLLAFGVVALVRNATVTGCAITAIAGCVVALLQVNAVWTGPLADAAADSREATIWGVVQTDPQPRAGPAWQSAPQSTFSLATSAMQVGSERTALAVPVNVICSCSLDDVSVGAAVQLAGRLVSSRDPLITAEVRMENHATVTQTGNPGLADATANLIRRELSRALAGIDAGPASLVAGLSTGDVSLMPPELTDQMRATGMAHLTAVSGANVAIVLACVIGIAALLRARIRVRVAVALVSILGFVVLVRPEPSVVRAAVMGAVVVVSMLSGGRKAGPAVLAVAVLLLVLLAPALAVSWAFALSVAATLGIVLLASRAERWLPARTPPMLALALGITIAAQLATIPVLLLMGISVSWVSVPANVLAGVAVAPVTVLGLIAALLAPVALPVAVLLAHVAAVPATFIAWIASWAEGLPGARLQWPAGVAGFALLAGCIVIAPTLRKYWRRPFTLIVAFVVLLLLVDPPGSRAWPPSGWVLVACDVGQGDALVVRGSGDAVMVVDTGPDATSLTACLRDLDVTRIGALVLTHFHADHVGGLIGALSFPVDAVVVSPVHEPPETFETAQRALLSSAHDVRIASPGMQITLPGIDATVLWPGDRIEDGSVPNNASVVLDVLVNGVRVLLSGDVEREAQARLAALPRRPFDVVKVPHHGSANLDEGFVAWAQAPIALISVGIDNDYGHPAPAALSAWSRSITGRTDTDGAVAVVQGDRGLALVRRG